MIVRGKRKGRAKTNYEVPAQEFIRIWETSRDAEEVSQRTRMPIDIVHARASNYRKAGVKLKKLERKSKAGGLDVDGLNQLIKAIRSRSARERTEAASRTEAAVRQVISSVFKS